MNCMYLFLLALVGGTIAQYVLPVTDDVLAGNYAGVCEALNVSATAQVSISEQANITNTGNFTIVLEAFIGTATCSSSGALATITITETGYFIIGNLSSGINNAYDLDIYYLNKTLYFTNGLIVPLALKEVNNSQNQPCFPSSLNLQANTYNNIQSVDCDVLGLYPCAPLPQLSVIQVQQVTTPSNGYDIYLGLGGGGCSTPRPTSVSPGLFRSTGSASTTTTGTTTGSGGSTTTTTGSSGGNSGYTPGSASTLISWLSLF